MGNEQYMSLNEARLFENRAPETQLHLIGRRLRYAMNQGIGWKDEERYYVDANNGSDSNDGLSWDTAFRTIQYAVNKARYYPNTTTIDARKDHHKYVFIWPGQYNEQVLFGGYNIHLVGIGDNGVGGGDYGVVINYDDAIAATGVMGFTGVNIEVCNITFNTTAAIPGITIPSVSDGIHIHHCLFKGADTKTPTNAIDIPSFKGGLIEHNVIQGWTYGIKTGYAAGAWFYLSIIRENHIVNVTNGIDIAAGAVCGLSKIQRNTVQGSGTSIVNGQATDVIICENYVKPVISDAGSAEGDNTTLS